MKDIRVASVQFQHVAGDKPANLAVMQGFVEAAARAHVQLIAFPECCITGYWHLRELDRAALDQLAEPIPQGPSARQLLDWSQARSMTIGAGLVERSADGKLYNSYFVAMPNGQYACHRKIHCFISAHMDSGDRFTVFDSPHGCRLGTLICYDNNIVENVRACALDGAEILLAPHQTGGCHSGSPFAMGVIPRHLWDDRERNPLPLEAALRGDKGRGWLLRWLPSRAHDNGLFVIFSNGIGPDGDEVRTGNAMILDPYGRIIRETWRAGNAMIVADLQASLRDRCTGARWLRARRPDLYRPLVLPTGREQDTRTVRFQ